MVTDNFFYNSELYRDYSELVVERQVRGSDLLICCLDTGKYYDSFSLAMLHSYCLVLKYVDSLLLSQQRQLLAFFMHLIWSFHHETKVRPHIGLDIDRLFF